MAGFQTNVFRDGQWVTTSVSTQEALDATAKIDAQAFVRPQPPDCGIITRTVIPSPVAHWVLPIRIRSKSQIDVAFVGSHAVQISELRNDGQLIHVARKDDFGSRICNAVVMGDTPNSPKDIIGGDQTSIKIEDAMESSAAPFSRSAPPNKRRVLPPQILVLFLENGLLVFLFLSPGVDAGPAWIFELMQKQTPWAIKNLGFRLAIDPTSRYIAAASSQKAFMIWELESRANIEEQYEQHGFFHPLKQGDPCVAVRAFQGTLFHFEFLFPRPEDVDHIILMMVVARRDCHDSSVASRVLTFDWIAGEDLRNTIEGDGNGIRLPEHYQLPLMIIPLRFKNSMCVVAERSIGVIKNAISGSMVCEDLMTEQPPRTPLHYGASEPLWAAWARPIRGDWYCKNTDIIMLAREDGYLVHIEVDAANVVPSVTSAGCLDSTISTGFAMPYIDDADAIIVSGDSSPGGTWKLSPRDDPVRASILRNWSPVVDITAAPFAASTTPSPAMSTGHASRPEAEVLVAASGRGAKGNLASFRWGRQARIGCDIDTESTIRQIGAFVSPQGNRLLQVGLSLPEATLVLEFSGDLSEVRALEADETPLDVGSCTLILHSTSDSVVQVTETSITLITEITSHREPLQNQDIFRADHAVCTSNHTVLSSLVDGASVLHIYNISVGSVKPLIHWRIQGEVTCIATLPSNVGSSDTFIVGTLVEGYPWISCFNVDGQQLCSQAIAPDEPPTTQHGESDDNALYEGITSIQISKLSDNSLTLLMGTLWGRLLTFEVSRTMTRIRLLGARKFGRSPVRLFPLAVDAPGCDLIASCDDNLVLLSEFDSLTQKHGSDAMIIPMSDDDAGGQSPPIQWVSAAPKKLQVGSSLTPLLLLAGTRVLIAELSATASLIPRSIPTYGTPTKVIYSDLWRCYIVAVTKDGRPTIHFLDPATGSIISQPTNNVQEPTEFAVGFGTEGDRVLSMEEWAYMKDDRVFPYILVGMQSGSVLTISARDVKTHDEGSGLAESDSTRRRSSNKASGSLSTSGPLPASGFRSGAAPVREIQYWMRHKRKGRPGEPAYAVLGASDGIVQCTGTTVFYDILDVQNKKMKDFSHFELDSPALKLSITQGQLFVLTSRHSLLILDYRSPRADGVMPLLHADLATRSTIHMLPVEMPATSTSLSTRKSTSSTSAPTSDHSNIVTMLSDASGNVVGVWTAIGQKEQPLETIFKAVLPVPVRRFVQARCRPPWYEPRESGKFGTVSADTNSADIFGVALDGALYHFTIITQELWELLRFIQSHLQDGKAQLEDEERRRHINGDLIARCLASQALEKDVLKASQSSRRQLFKLMDRIEGGALTKGLDEGAYIRLVYHVLEYLVMPVL